jgi:[lysine-biosynthesis-protein LysW]--L-2-aminoadipate ligase
LPDEEKAGAIKVGVLCSRVRLEEKLIFQALRKRGAAFEKIDVRQVTFDLNGTEARDCDVVLIRCMSHSRALYTARLLQMQGVKTVSSYETLVACGDKVLTTLALLEHDVPTPRTAITLSEESALESIEEIGYPAVLKPPVGSWGRLMAKVNDRQAAEALIEHKVHDARCRNQDATFYIQDYIHKPGRDIRTLVVGDETVYAVYRNSRHWITNTARGGNTSSLPLAPGDDIDRLSRAAAQAVGGEIVAVDILEAPDGSLLVNEVNHTPEFHGAREATDVDIAGKMVDYILEVRCTSREEI